MLLLCHDSFTISFVDSFFKFLCFQFYVLYVYVYVVTMMNKDYQNSELNDTKL